MQSFELVFDQGLERGVIDRPVEIVFREVEGLPKGTVKAVIDAYGELVDEGCLAVFGPAITDNCVPTREAIEERFHVPAISMTGTDDWLGEWTFSLPQGSHDRRADLLGASDREGRPRRPSASSSSSRWSVSPTSETFRAACARKGIRIVAEEAIAQTAQDISQQVTQAARGEARRHRALRLRVRRSS